ncbi:hypothetical protein D3C74_08040 [compost metagenome]
MFATIDYETGQVHHREEEKADTAVRFLKDLLAAYPDGKIALILDNSRIHHATKLQPFLEEHPRLHWSFCHLTVQISTLLRGYGCGSKLML